MNRRAFLQTAGTAGIATGLGPTTARAYIPEHNWEKYDWGDGPVVKDRLYQGPFPQYAPGPVVPDSDVVMVTTPSKDIVPNYGVGLVVYVSGDLGPPRLAGENLEKSIEDLIKIPFTQKIYIRPNWREVQKQPGKLDLPDWWQITFDLAKQYNKRVGFRIMLENPDFGEPGMPEFLMEKVPYLKLKGEWKRTSAETPFPNKEHKMPQYEHPAYQAAFRELNELLAAEYNGNPQVEYMDTMMYGFWGEAHTWPYEGNAFPSNVVAEQTWMKMLETQLELWTKTPLVTNTEPDFSQVGNSDLLDRTIRTHNWIRTDTIFIENTQIEALSNRPAWTAVICEVGMTTGDPERVGLDEGVTYNEKITSHVLDVGANYWSVWNWHNIAAAHVMSYYEKYPEPIDYIARHIGYRVYPSYIWAFNREGAPGLVVGLANKGVAGVPGVLRLTVFSDDRKVNVSGCVDGGYPKPTGIRQAMLMLPPGTKWEGLKLKAELDVKGIRHPMNWACQQKTNADGSLTLRHNLRA